MPSDLSEILIPYEGKWIVISADNKQVLASGNSFGDIKNNVSNGIAMKVPNFDSAMSPTALV